MRDKEFFAKRERLSTSLACVKSICLHNNHQEPEPESSCLYFPSTQPRTMRGWSSPLSKGLARSHGRTLRPLHSLARNHSPSLQNSPAAAAGLQPIPISSISTSSCCSSSSTPPLRQSPRTVFKMAPFTRHRRNSSTAVAVEHMPRFAFAFE